MFSLFPCLQCGSFFVLTKHSQPTQNCWQKSTKTHEFPGKISYSSFSKSNPFTTFLKWRKNEKVNEGKTQNLRCWRLGRSRQNCHSQSCGEAWISPCCCLRRGNRLHACTQPPSWLPFSPSISSYTRFEPGFRLRFSLILPCQHGTWFRVLHLFRPNLVSRGKFATDDFADVATDTESRAQNNHHKNFVLSLTPLRTKKQQRSKVFKKHSVYNIHCERQFGLLQNRQEKNTFFKHTQFARNVNNLISEKPQRAKKHSSFVVMFVLWTFFLPHSFLGEKFWQQERRTMPKVSTAVRTENQNLVSEWTQELALPLSCFVQLSTVEGGRGCDSPVTSQFAGIYLTCCLSQGQGPHSHESFSVFSKVVFLQTNLFSFLFLPNTPWQCQSWADRTMAKIMIPCRTHWWIQGALGSGPPCPQDFF